MADSGIDLPAQFTALLEERRSLWAQYDAAQSVAGRLRTLNTQVPAAGPVAALPAPTEAQSPPNETREAVTGLDRTLEEITGLNNRIESSQIEIKQILQRASTIKITLVVIAIVIIVIGLLLITHP